MGTSIYFIIVAIIIVLSVYFLIAKYFLYPLFFKPNLKSLEINGYLNDKQCVFIDSKNLNKNEKQRNIFGQSRGLGLDFFFSAKSEFKIIAFCLRDNRYNIYWVELKWWFLPLGKRILNFIPEENPEILNKIQNEYSPKTLIVIDRCPACNNELKSNETECKSCGLNLNA